MSEQEPSLTQTGGSMKIGLFTSDFPFKGEFTADDLGLAQTAWGGVAEVVYQMALLLNSQGHSVKIFTTSPTKRDIVQKFENIEVHRYRKDWKVASTALSLGLIRKPLDHDLDIVHGHLGTPPGAYAASVYSRKRHKPFVLTIHTPYNKVSLEGGSYSKRIALRLFMNRFCTPLLDRANVITSVSGAVLEESPYYKGFIPRVIIIPNGVDTGKLTVEPSKEECHRILGIPSGKRVVLFIGSLSTYKNPELLLDAFSRLDLISTNAYMVMVGDGPLHSKLIETRDQRGLKDKVMLPGFVSEQEKMQYYKAADMLVLPSLAEAFPLVLLEASAFGLPLIVSDIDVFKEVMKDGHNGLIFKGGVADDLRSKLALLLNDDARRDAMGRNSKAFITDYEWSKLLERYGQIYRGLVP